METSQTKQILKKRLQKLEKNHTALSEYKTLIDDMLKKKDIYSKDVFQSLKPQEKAIFDAYLKRFSSTQDFLGSKIFPLLLDISGINSSRMSEVLYHIEREGIIDTLEKWIELREVRNELEHDYPEILDEALEDLKFCVESFQILDSYYKNSLEFASRYL